MSVYCRVFFFYSRPFQKNFFFFQDNGLELWIFLFIFFNDDHFVLQPLRIEEMKILFSRFHSTSRQNSFELFFLCLFHVSLTPCVFFFNIIIMMMMWMVIINMNFNHNDDLKTKKKQIIWHLLAFMNSRKWI